MSSKDSLRVLTLNLQRGKPREHFAWGLAEIAALDPEVVLVQEADNNSIFSGRVNHTKLIADACGLKYWQFLPGRSTWATVLPLISPRPKKLGDSGTGVGVISRYPARWHTHHLKTNRPLMNVRSMHVDMDQPRQVLAATLDMAGVSITVASTHLSWLGGVGVDQLRQAEAFLQRLPGPWVLGGDFNIRSNQSIWPSLVYGNTYPADQPKFQMDYIVSPLEASRTAIRRFAFSDHRGVLADVILPST